MRIYRPEWRVETEGIVERYLWTLPGEQYFFNYRCKICK